MVEFTYKNATYLTNFANITQLKFMLNQEFKERFFSKESKRIHGDVKYKWSKKNQELTVIALRLGVLVDVIYMPEYSEGELTLRLKK